MSDVLQDQKILKDKINKLIYKIKYDDYKNCFENVKDPITIYYKLTINNNLLKNGCKYIIKIKNKNKKYEKIEFDNTNNTDIDLYLQSSVFKKK